RLFNLVWIPSPIIEYAYYLVVSYSIVAPFLGIEVPLVAAGITVALAGFCLTQMGSRAKKVFAPIGVLFACIISFIIVQIVVHGASIIDETIRYFILWICGMIIVQSLCLRPGFLRRCTIVLFVIGLITLPYLVFSGDQRAAAGIDIQGGLRNPNGL